MIYCYHSKNILGGIGMTLTRRAISEGTAEQARIALIGIKESQLVIKLQTIISCANHQVETVSSIIGKDRVTVWRWIRAFKDNGVEGLRDKPRGHNPSKLNEEQREQIAIWLNTGKNSQGEPTHWTLKKLSVTIEEEYGIKLTKTPLWITIQSMGFRQKVPRQTHASADREKQNAFKKNC
jgi:Transposase and inactivated derivatives